MSSKNPQDMADAVALSMKARTGRTLEEWVAAVNSSGVDPLDQIAVRRWLKAEHGVLQNSQWAIAVAAARAAGWKAPTTEEYIDRQYTGARAGLRPIFNRLRTLIEALGDDVRTEGRASYTPFVRRRQFVAIAAATRSRVDVGLRFSSVPKSKLLVEATAPGQATHKLSLESESDITNEVRSLLQAAYDQNG
ncbi:MAG TPA: DUF5655 domain-containing protein [Gemmatimonadales bacterium]|nr:DUF5655 domain-containing protein [Gemmatimonadales bacterium]